jgi:hypothetical protein
LFEFSKIHQYDDRSTFKDAWKNWIEENNDEVCQEIRRLDHLGYEGDILDKMFKSARYYFRKKSTTKKAPKERRNYVSCHKTILDAMDSHIEMGIKNDNYKPSEGFDVFCFEHVELLKEEIPRLMKENIIDKHEIVAKIKKTYKNRYFIISKLEIN